MARLDGRMRGSQERVVQGIMRTRNNRVESEISGMDRKGPGVYRKSRALEENIANSDYRAGILVSDASD